MTDPFTFECHYSLLDHVKLKLQSWLSFGVSSFISVLSWLSLSTTYNPSVLPLLSFRTCLSFSTRECACPHSSRFNRTKWTNQILAYFFLKWRIFRQTAQCANGFLNSHLKPLFFCSTTFTCGHGSWCALAIKKRMTFSSVSSQSSHLSDLGESSSKFAWDIQSVFNSVFIIC